MVAIGMQRYLAVCKPQTAQKYASVGMVCHWIWIICLFFTIYNIPRFFAYKPLYNNSTSDYVAEEVDWPQGIVITYRLVLYYLIIYAIPLILIGYSTFHLIREVKVARKRRQRMTSQPHSQSENDVTRSLIAVIIVFVTCQLCSPIRRLLNEYVNEQGCGSVYFYVKPILMLAVVLNSAINFILFVIFSSGFRKKVKQNFNCSGLQKKNSVGVLRTSDSFISSNY